MDKLINGCDAESMPAEEELKQDEDGGREKADDVQVLSSGLS